MEREKLRHEEELERIHAEGYACANPKHCAWRDHRRDEAYGGEDAREEDGLDYWWMLSCEGDGRENSWEVGRGAWLEGSCYYCCCCCTTREMSYLY